MGPASQSAASQLAVITNELDQLAPRFDVPASSIDILREPAEFYEVLKVLFLSSSERGNLMEVVDC